MASTASVTADLSHKQISMDENVLTKENAVQPSSVCGFRVEHILL